MVDGVWQGRAERFARGRLTTTMDNFEGRVLLLQTKSLTKNLRSYAIL